MKRFTYFCAALIGGTAAIVALSSRRPVPVPQPESAAAISTPVAARPQPKTPVIVIDEPILVLPEVETAPLPEPMNLVAINVPILAASDFAIGASRPSPRPEANHDGRPWMPYAAEDKELSATRRLEWTKILVREADQRRRDDAFEETQEPPLLSDAADDESRSKKTD